ncbi:MAG TPA: hypothetical protein VFW44_07675 [Bryobacteraceae bacterium]|nr:hypothetical protein [Bryobacteraceae bacterium]
MSNGNQEIDRVRRARHVLEKMRGRLLRPNPDALEASAADLNLAVEFLRQLDVTLQSPIWHGTIREKMEAEVVALRRTVRAVDELLKNAGKFYAGLARLLAPDEAPANYTARGGLGSAAPEPARSLVLQG